MNETRVFMLNGTQVQDIVTRLDRRGTRCVCG